MLKGTSYICLIAKFWFLWDRGSRGAVIGPSHQNYGLVFHKQSFCIATSARFGNAAKKMRSVTAPSQRPYFSIIYGQPGLCSSCSPLKLLLFPSHVHMTKSLYIQAEYSLEDSLGTSLCFYLFCHRAVLFLLSFIALWGASPTPITGKKNSDIDMNTWDLNTYRIRALL